MSIRKFKFYFRGPDGIISVAQQLSFATWSPQNMCFLLQHEPNCKFEFYKYSVPGAQMTSYSLHNKCLLPRSHYETGSHHHITFLDVSPMTNTRYEFTTTMPINSSRNHVSLATTRSTSNEFSKGPLSSRSCNDILQAIADLQKSLNDSIAQNKILGNDLKYQIDKLSSRSDDLSGDITNLREILVFLMIECVSLRLQNPLLPL